MGPAVSSRSEAGRLRVQGEEAPDQRGGVQTLEDAWRESGGARVRPIVGLSLCTCGLLRGLGE